MSRAFVVSAALKVEAQSPKRIDTGGPPSLPHIDADALSERAVALIVQARAVAVGFGAQEFGGHSLKRGALTAGMNRGVHATRLTRLGQPWTA